MSETHDCGGDAAAYVLGALDPSEAEEFRRHLDICAICRDEVAAFAPVVDALPMGTPQHPLPRKLRRRVMRDVHAEADLAGEGGRRQRWPVSARLAPRAGLAGGLLAATVLAIVGGIQLASSGSSSVRVIQAKVTTPPGSAQVRVAGAHAELIVSHLSPPPSGRIYEVWLQRGGQAPSPTHALFGVTTSGAAEVGVPGDLRGVSAILVTPEPAGGSLTPTHPPVIVAHVD